MGDFITDRTTTTSRFEEVNQLEFPTVTFCINPPQKPSVAKKFGLQSAMAIHHSFDYGINDIPNTTLPERIDDISYILNRDFEILTIFRLKFGQGPPVPFHLA